MLQSVEGIYRNGTIELLETPHNIHESRVLITFLATSESNSIEPKASPPEKKKRNGFGILKGKISMSDDFDEPLEEFEEYL
jgi:hypothetical protein